MSASQPAAKIIEGIENLDANPQGPAKKLHWVRFAANQATRSRMSYR